LDIITVCCLRRKFSPHERTFREVLNDSTHIAGIGGRQILGRKKQKYVLENPEAFLGRFTGDIGMLFKD